jgi:hypothetical protein
MNNTDTVPPGTIVSYYLRSDVARTERAIFKVTTEAIALAA